MTTTQGSSRRSTLVAASEFQQQRLVEMIREALCLGRERERIVVRVAEDSGRAKPGLPIRLHPLNEGVES